MDHHGAGIDPSLWVAIDGFKGTSTGNTYTKHMEA